MLSWLKFLRTLNANKALNYMVGHRLFSTDHCHRNIKVHLMLTLCTVINASDSSHDFFTQDYLQRPALSSFWTTNTFKFYYHFIHQTAYWMVITTHTKGYYTLCYWYELRYIFTLFQTQMNFWAAYIWFFHLHFQNHLFPP